MLQKQFIFFGSLVCFAALNASDASESKQKPASDNCSQGQEKINGAPTFDEVLATRIAASPSTIQKHIASFLDSHVYIPWKIFTVAADLHLEFTDHGRFLVAIARSGVPEMTVRDMCTGVVVSNEAYTVYADSKRSHNARSREWSHSSTTQRGHETRVVEMRKPPVSIEHTCFKNGQYKAPDTVALSPNKKVFAVGTNKSIFLYKKPIILQELIEQNRHVNAAQALRLLSESSSSSPNSSSSPSSSSSSASSMALQTHMHQAAAGATLQNHARAQLKQKFCALKHKFHDRKNKR